jgi:TetR/AcrR family transcriptional regulator, transcriptional repressor for nem operon
MDLARSSPSRAELARTSRSVQPTWTSVERVHAVETGTSRHERRTSNYVVEHILPRTTVPLRSPAVPFTAEHKARTRTRIVACARVMFNRNGFDQVTIDGVMKSAGLTRGGFYNHFSSKEDLYAEAVRSFATCNPFARESEELGGHRSAKEAARRLVELYLSDAVLNDVDQHCPLIALPSDVARAGLEPRSAYTFIVRRMLAVFRAGFPASDAQAPAKAQVILNLCVGGMVVARTTDDPLLRQSLRSAALDQALRLLGQTARPTKRRRRSHPTRKRR